MSPGERSGAEPAHGGIATDRSQPTNRLNALEVVVAVLIATHPDRQKVMDTLGMVVQFVGTHPDAGPVYGNELRALVDRLSHISGVEGDRG